MFCPLPRARKKPLVSGLGCTAFSRRYRGRLLVLIPNTIYVAPSIFNLLSHVNNCLERALLGLRLATFYDIGCSDQVFRGVNFNPTIGKNWLYCNL